MHEYLANYSKDWPRQLIYDMNWSSGQIFPPDGWKPEWPVERKGPCEVISHEVYKLPHGFRVVQELKAPGCEGLMVQSIFIPDYEAFIELETSWSMGVDTHPQANYIYYPINLKNAVARYDVGGTAVIPERDQLDGVCRDYFTTQRWVDLSNDEMGITIATPQNPLFMLGEFSFGKGKELFELNNSTFIGWVTNNYWETNFRAHQPGLVKARYRLIPHGGTFNETSAHKYGLEAAYAQPLLQNLGEIPPSPPILPKAASLLSLPSGENGSTVVVMHVKPDLEERKVIVRMLNTGDTLQEAVIGFGIVRVTGAELLDVLDNPISQLEVHKGKVKIGLEPREFLSVALSVEI